MWLWGLPLPLRELAWVREIPGWLLGLIVIICAWLCAQALCWLLLPRHGATSRHQRGPARRRRSPR
jgi:hypothetical protein